MRCVPLRLPVGDAGLDEVAYDGRARLAGVRSWLHQHRPRGEEITEAEARIARRDELLDPGSSMR
jgi:hypothetical protein